MRKLLVALLCGIRDQSGPHIFNWPNITLAAGPNSVEAIGSTDTETFTDSVTWMR
jgi:hypothetical protein